MLSSRSCTIFFSRRETRLCDGFSDHLRAALSVDFLADFFDPDLEIVDGEVGTPSFFSASSVAPGSGSWTSLRLFVCRPRK